MKKKGICGVNSLSGLNLGVIQDYAYDDDIDEYIEVNGNRGQKVQVATGDNALEISVRKLLAGRIDVFIEDRTVFLAYINKIGKEDEVRFAGALEGVEVFVSFCPTNPKSEVYAEILSDGIAGFRESGELDRILEKYGLTDWE